MADEILLTDEEFKTAIIEAGLEKSLNKYTAKISDKKVSEGIRTREKNIQAKNLTDSEKIANLETELKELKAGKTKDVLDTQIKKELKAQNLSEDLIKYIRIDDPEKIVESVENLKNDLLEAKQAVIDEQLKEGEAPLKGDTSAGTSIPTAVKAYAEKISDIKK